MNNATKITIQSIGIGIFTMLLGALAIRISNPSLNIKSYLFPLFITGIALYLALEFSGAHKSFCGTYTK